MLGRNYSQSPEVVLMNRESRDKTKLVGRCGDCIHLKESFGIPHCSDDRDFFINRFKWGERCSFFIHTR